MATVIIKPTHDCNLACEYCYLIDKAEKGRMSNKTLVCAMEQSVKDTNKRIHFLWHGGEPLLMGIDFFKEVANISFYLRKSGRDVSNSIQSNGTLITDEFLDFVEEQNDFHIGLSIDGPKHINDITRKYPDGRGAFDCIMSGIKKIRERKNKVGAILVLNKSNISHMKEILEFFVTENINPKINPIIDSEDIKWGISPKEYGKAMIDLFDLWITTVRLKNRLDYITDYIQKRYCIK